MQNLHKPSGRKTSAVLGFDHTRNDNKTTPTPPQPDYSLNNPNTLLEETVSLSLHQGTQFGEV